ncbi:MAG: alpha-L-fucosidase, partial [Verrucomicrobiota bacterium]
MMAMKFGDGRDWFLEKRFGMFVHWGLYAINAWQEQEQQRLSIPRQEYEKLISRFNPANFDPDAWIDLAQKAGMEYLTFTAKHLDGFCMWDTDQTDYKVTRSPYGKDVLAKVAEACHRRDFPLCIYYCLVDNHHPSYPISGKGHALKQPEPDDVPNLEKYLGYVRKQVRELCTDYGKIHGFWWDVNQLDHVDPSFNAMIRELQPGVVINDRGFSEADFGTPERDWVKSIDEDLEFDKLVEACNSVGKESWGYRIDEDYFTTVHLMRGIANMFAKGGNYLLNVGPDADGVVPPQAVERLEKIGNWLGNVKEALYGTA